MLEKFVKVVYVVELILTALLFVYEVKKFFDAKGTKTTVQLTRIFAVCSFICQVARPGDSEVIFKFFESSCAWLTGCYIFEWFD